MKKDLYLVDVRHWFEVHMMRVDSGPSDQTLFSVFCLFFFSPSFSIFGGGFSACMNTVTCKDTVVSIYGMHGWVGTPVRAQGSPADRSKDQV